MISNSSFLITGGSGFLGQHLLHKLSPNNEIFVYSRDEAKHYYLKKKFPSVNFIVGDIRDRNLLTRVSRNIDYGIFAASLKQIAACDENPEEATQIILNGAINSKYAALENNFKAAAFISTDKSRAATTIYGSLKFAAGEQFIIKNCYEKYFSTKLSTIIYGNVLNSTGSIIPLIWQSIKTGSSLTLFNPNMTRFIITADQAVDLIYEGLNYDGVSIIPKASSILVRHLFEIYSEYFGLQYSVSEPRLGEKIHEVLASREEIPRMFTTVDTSCYLLSPSFSRLHGLTPAGLDSSTDYSSEDCVISKSELNSILSAENYYQPL